MTTVKKITSESGEPMLSARVAAKRLDCAQDYVGKLLREGKLRGAQIQGAWFVEESSLGEFEAARTRAKLERAEALTRERKLENEAYRKAHGLVAPVQAAPAVVPPQPALFSSLLMRNVALALGGVLLFAAVAFAGAVHQREVARTQSSLAASLAQVDSPFFGAHSFGVELSLPSRSLASDVVSKIFSFFLSQKPVTNYVYTPPPAPSVSAATTTVINNMYPVVEHVVSGITQATLTEQLNALRDFLLPKIEVARLSPRNSSSHGGSSSSGGSGSVTSVDASGGTTGLSFSGGPVTGTGTLTLGGILGVDNGGTGTSSAPTFGQLLIGNSSGGYDFVSTTSLGITAGSAGWGQITGTLSDQTDLQAALDARLTLANWYATTTDGLDEGTTNKYYHDASVQTYLDTISKGYFFSTTSVDYYLAMNPPAGGSGFSTTSADYWKTQNNFFSTSSVAYWQSVTDLFSTTSAEYFVHASSTIPKTYTDNTFTGNNTFTGTFTLGTATGLLSAQNGLVSAVSTSSLGLLASSSLSAVAPLAYDANTGTFSIQQADGSQSGYLSSADWTLFNNKVSSSSLSAFVAAAYPFSLPGNATSTLTQFNGGLTAFASTTIGNGTLGLTISGNSTTTGTAYFAGNVGIGTTMPAGTLEVVGTTDFTALQITNSAVSTASVFNITGPISTDTNTGKAFSFKVNGEVYARGLFYTDGTYGIGSGAGPRDVYISRSAANTLRISSNGTNGPANLVVNGNIGIGTTSPYAKLSVVGTTVAANFVATTTTQNVFPNVLAQNATTTSLYIGSLSGLLIGTNGQVSAVSTSSLKINTDDLVEGTTNQFFTNERTDDRVAALLQAGSGVVLNYNDVGNTLTISASGGGGGGSDVNWTYFNNSGLYPATSTNQVLIGGTSTSTLADPFAKLGVFGGASIDYATTTALFSTTAAFTDLATTNFTFSNATGLLLATGGTVSAVSTSSLGLLASSSLSAVAPLAYDANTGTFSIQQADGSQSGYLSSTDWTLFNNKVSSSSLSDFVAAAYPFSLPGNATSTLTQFNGGLTAYASTTIGDGTATGGLTISGNATTTGASYLMGQVQIGDKTVASATFFPLAVTGSDSGGTSIIVKNSNTAGVARLYLVDGNNGNNLLSTKLNNSATAYNNLTVVPNSAAITTGTQTTGGIFFVSQAAAPIVFANGGTASSSERLRIDTTGNVGIGTTSPYAKLSVVGSSELGNSATAGYFIATSTTPSQFNGGLTAYASSTIGGGTQTTGLTVYGGATTTGNAYFANNVGIGTPKPNASLDIGGLFTTSAIGSFTPVADLSVNTNSIAGVEMRNTSNGSSADFRFAISDNNGSTGNYFAFSMPGSGNTGTLFGQTRSTLSTLFTAVAQSGAGNGRILAIGTVNNNDILFGTNNTEQVRITAAGNVGVGTTSPYAKLAVVGQVAAAYFTATTTATSTFPTLLSTNATTTTFAVTSQSAGCAQFLASGALISTGVSCGTGSGTGGFAADTNYGVSVSATTTPIWAQNGFFASSTSHFADSDFVNATTSAFAISGISSGNLLKTTTGGSVVAAVAGTDYENPLTFNGPLSRSVNTVSITQSSTGADGYLSASDYTLFTNKVSSSSLSGASVISYNSSTGVISTQAGTFGGSASSVYTFPGDLVVTGTATTGSLYVNGAITGAGLTSCSDAVDKLIWSATTQQFQCATDAGSGGSSEINWTYFNGSGVRVSTSSNQVLIGGTSTSTLSMLEVAGGATIDNATTTSLYNAGIASFAGNVGLGTTSPYQKLSVAGGNIVQVASGNPTLGASVSLGGSTYGVVTVGNYAYVAGGAVRVVDITNPLNPVLVGSYTGISQAQSIVVSGKYAYVGDASAGLVVLDVSKPASPQLVATLSGAGHALQLALSGRYLFVPDFDGNNLNVIDVANPAAPTIVGTYVTDGAPAGVAVQGKYAYVGSEAFGTIATVDISDPAHPTEVYSYSGANGPQYMYVSGRYLYVADISDGLYIIDISNPLATTLAGSKTGTGYYAVTVAGGYAYDADASGNVIQLDVRDPADIATVGIYATGGSPRGIALSGKYAYVTTGGSTLDILDINGATLPAANIGALQTDVANVAANLTVGGEGYFDGGLNVGVSGIFSRGGLAVLGSTTLTDLIAHNATTTNATTTNLAISGIASGNLLKTTTGGSVVAAVAGTDYVTPSALALAYPFALAGNATSTLTQFNGGLTAFASSTIGDGTNGLTVYGNATTTGNAYFAGNVGVGTTTPASALHIADGTLTIDSPVNPAVVATISGAGAVEALTVQGKYLYANNGTNLNVYDITDPVHPVLAGSRSGVGAGSNGGWDVQVAGQYAYVVAGSAGLRVYDVGNPQNAVLLGSNDPGGFGHSVSVQGRFAYYTNGSAVHVVDISNPKSPTIVANTLPDSSVAATAVGNYLYSGNIQRFWIYNIGSSTVPIQVSSTTVSGTVNNIRVAGSFAYLAENTGLDIYNVSNATAPVLAASMSSLGHVVNIEVAGKYLYAINNAKTFYVIDISSSTNPYIVGSLASAGSGQSSTNGHMGISGHYVYVQDPGSGTIKVVDIKGAEISNAFIGSLEAGRLNVDDSLQVANSAYVGGGLSVTGGLAAFNSSSIYASSSIAALTISQNGIGKLLGVGTSTPWAQFSFDTSNISGTGPSFVVGSSTKTDFVITQGGNVGIGTTSPYAKLSVVGSVVAANFVATTSTASVFPYASTTAITVSGTASTTNLRISGTQTFENLVSGALAVNTSGQVYKAATTTFSTGLTYTNGAVTCDTASASVFGCLSSTDWTLFNNKVSSSSLLSTVAAAYPFALAGNATSTLTQFNGGLTAYASTTIGNGTATGGLTISGNATTTGNAYFAGNVGIGTSTPAARLHVTDGTLLVDSMTQPVLVGSTTQSSGQGVPAISGHYAYYPNGSHLNIVDISDPTSPVLVDDSITPVDWIENVAVNGSYLYVLEGRSFHVFDISSTTSPLHTGSVSVCGGNWGRGISPVIGSKVYLVCGGRLYVLNVSNPNAPTQLLVDTTTFSGTTAADSIFVQGNYAYINGQTGLHVLDIADLANVQQVGTYALSMSGAYHQSSVYVSGKYAYLVNNEIGLTILDISDPKSPALVSSYSDTTVTNGSVAGKYIYLIKPTALDVVDISNVSTPFKAGTVAATFYYSAAPEVTVVGKYAYANDGKIFDLGGIDASVATIGSLTTSNLYAAEFATIGNSLNVGNGLAVGNGGILSNGAVYIHASSTGTGFSALRVTSDGTQNILDLYDGTSKVFTVQDGGNVGIGTTSPYLKLSVVGASELGNYARAGYFIATTTTASQFPYASTTAITVSGTASTSNTIVSNNLTVANLSGLLKATNGLVSTAVAGTDYVTPAALGLAFPFTTTTFGATVANATSTLIGFTQGLYALASSTIGNGTLGLTINGTATTTGTAYFAGNVGIGTTTPYARLSVAGEVVAANFTATSTTATSTFAGGLNVGNGALTYDFSQGVTSIQNLQLGSLSFDTDAGQISWVDLPVSGAAATGTIESYTAQLGGTPLLTLYGEATGYLGGASNLRIGIGTTTPYATLSVEGTSALGNSALAGYFVATSTTASQFAGGLTAFASSTIGNGSTTGGLTINGTATTTGFAYFNGNVGIGTTSPPYKLGVQGDGAGANGIRVANLSSTGQATVDVNSDTALGYFRAYGSGVGFGLGGNTGFGSNSSIVLFTNGNVSSGGTDSIQFRAGGYNSTQERARITADGSLAIGTTSPWARLSVDTSSLASGVPSFVVGSSSVLSFMVDQGGNTTINGNTFLTGSNRYLNFGTATSSIGFGLRESGGQIQFRNNQGTTTASAANWISVSDAALVRSQLSESGWVNTGSTLPGSLRYSSTAVIGDYVYLFGGDTGSAAKVIYRAPLSNPTSWTNTGATLPANLNRSGSLVIGDYVYLFGGYTGSAETSVIYRAPVSNPTSWVDTGATISGTTLSGSVVAVIGDYVYRFGGNHTGTGAVSTISRAPVSDPTSWTTLAATLPANLYYPQLAVVGDYVYLFGGFNSTAKNTIYRAPVSDPTNWADTGATIPGSIYNGHVAIIGDYVYLFGGNTGSPTNVIYRAPVSNPTAWSDTGYTLPGNLSGSSLAIIGSNVYLFGGNTGSATNVIYRAPITTNSSLNPTWAARQNATLNQWIAGSQVGAISYSGTVGIGTTSPWARLAVDTSSLASGVPSFAVGSSTRNDFVVTQSGNVGVGTAAPGSLFQVAGTRPSITLSDMSAGSNLKHWLFSSEGGNLYFSTASDAYATSSVAAFTILSNGRTGVGTTSPFAKFSIQANNGETNRILFAIGSSTSNSTTTLFSIDNTGVTTFGNSSGTGDAIFQFASDVNAWAVGYKSSDKSFNIASSTNLSGTAALSIAKNGNVTIVGSAVTCVIGNGSSATSCSSSDQRLKDNITALGDLSGLAAIDQLAPVTFNWNAWMQSNGSASTTQYGFIAQEVQKVFPTLVMQDPNSGYYKLDYQQLIPPAIKAIQELHLDLETLASTTASSTPASQSFADSVIANVLTHVSAWLADTGNGIANIFAQTLTATVVNADTVNTKTLCLDGLCVTKAELQLLLDNQHIQSAQNSSGTSGDTSQGTTTDNGGDTQASSTPPTQSGGDTASSTPQTPDNGSGSTDSSGGDATTGSSPSTTDTTTTDSSQSGGQSGADTQSSTSRDSSAATSGDSSASGTSGGNAGQTQ